MPYCRGVRLITIATDSNGIIYLQQLKRQRDKLKQYQKRIEISLVKERALAKKCLQMGRKE